MTEKLGERCIDDGRCHHQCKDKYFRRECCEPLSGYKGEWKYDQPPAAQPVATLYVGSEWGQELQDWEIEANQKVCERLNEQHAGNPTTLNLYVTPDPRIAVLEGLLREVVKNWNDEAGMPELCRTIERIAAALNKEGA